MAATLRHYLELVRFSHTIFALPFAVMAAILAFHASQAAGDVAALMVELVAESGSMLVVVTHDIAIADRVGGIRRLRDGRLES